MQEMEKPQSNQQQEQEEDEEFIDIEVSPLSKNSPPQTNREFEFQMSSSSSFSPSSSHHKQATTTADELFYNGKLLPLHLPPRLQMVQSLLEASRSFTAPPTSSNTPMDQSCNISPVESCRVSCELNPDEYFFNWSTEATSFFNNGTNSNCSDTHLSKRAWSKKIRLIKQSSLTQKLKSSKSYLKSLFLRSACSDEANCSSSKPSDQDQWGNVSRAREYVSKYIRLVKRNPFGEMEKDESSCTMKSILDREMDDQVSFTCHRKSFSGAIKRHCTSKCYSSSSSGSSSGCSSNSSSFSLKNSVGACEGKVLKRSISASSEVENSIQGAIAHCKRSQLKQDCCSEPSEIRPCLVAACSRRPEISRI